MKILEIIKVLEILVKVMNEFIICICFYGFVDGWDIWLDV